ncbi:MAG: hypothetical protein QXT25_02895, partial [Candidatus Anstonellaceae archaeon]
MFETKIDQLVSIVQRKKNISVEILSKYLHMPVETVELICAVLEKGGVLDLHYPLSITEKPTVSFRLMPAEPPKPEVGATKGKVLASYMFSADGVPASVMILDTEREKHYILTLVEFGTATKIFLDLIKDELLRAIPAGAQSDVSDIEKAAKAREEFKLTITNYIRQFHLGKEVDEVLVGMLLHKLFGLGEIE